MNKKEQNVTVMVIGSGGCGKSHCGNAFLMRNNAFDVSNLPLSLTLQTCSQSSIINGITRNYIEVQSLESNDELDSKIIHNFIEFLNNWELGINALFIIINIQLAFLRYDVQKQLQLINNFFDDISIWKQTGIIFTHCYIGNYDKKWGEKLYNQLIDYIKTMPGCNDIEFQIPCFYVDSKVWNTNLDTLKEFEGIFEFAFKNDPILTKKNCALLPNVATKEEQILKNILVKTELIGTGINRKRIDYYEDQQIIKYTDWKSNEYYSKPITLKSYTETVNSIIKKETKIEKKSSITEILKTEKKPKRYFGIMGPRKRREVHDYFINKTEFFEYTRDIIIDPVGDITVTDWVLTRQWEEVSKY